MLAVKIEITKGSLKEASHVLRAIPRAMPRVMRRAINRTVDSAGTDLKRRVGKEITAKKSEIAKGISKRKASLSRLLGTIRARFYRPGLLGFAGTKQTKRGVTYRISRRGGRKRIEHGFITRMQTGHRGVFVRKGAERLPIAEARGPSIWQVITDTAGLLKNVTDTAGDKLGKHINDQIGVELRRWRA